MSNAKQFSDLKARFVSASLFAIAAFFCAWYGSWLMLLMMLAFTYIGLKEWMDLPKERNYSTDTSRKWFGYGLLYVGWASVSILLVRFSDALGYEATIWVVSIAISTDVGAYFAGQFIGGPKVAPSISPKKTWAGVIGGIVVCVIFTSGELYVMDVDIGSKTVFLAIFLSLVSQVGDFFESHIKRRFQVKDTGSFLPGHGGLLDRMDGQIFVMIVASIFALYISFDMSDMATSLLQ